MSETQSTGTLKVDITKRFEPRKGKESLQTPFELRAITEIPAGITMLFGHSGSGKTTLLNCIAGLTTPDAGEITANGETWYSFRREINLPPQEREVGYQMQDLALFPHMTAQQNVMYGLAGISEKQQLVRVTQANLAFKIGHVWDRRPREMSGGEQQRVALARALVRLPKVLLLDEPLSSLDPATKTGIMDDLRAWTAVYRIPVLYVTHSREEVFALAERVIAMEKGEITGIGTPKEVLSGHRHESIANWLGVENVFEGDIVERHSEGTVLVKTGNIQVEVSGHGVPADGHVRFGLSAKDVLLATTKPEHISARNILPGRIGEIQMREIEPTAIVDCNGTRFISQVTAQSIAALELKSNKEVWVVFKTHSAFLITR
jgi:molybdate transport system ATP-binding protein